MNDRQQSQGSVQQVTLEQPFMADSGSPGDGG
jgi:hypothetical protein